MMILVTGGSGSGKSAFAEDCVVSFGKTDRIYIATMYPFDEESRKRVQRHRKMRQGKGFETVECYTGLDKIRLPENCTVLLCRILLQMRCFRKKEHMRILLRRC